MMCCSFVNFVGFHNHFDAEDVSLHWGGLHHFELVTKKMQDININAVIEGTQVAYLHMKSCNVTGDKFIVATASMAGLLATAGPIYGANKAAVVHFTRSLAEPRDAENYTATQDYTAYSQPRFFQVSQVQLFSIPNLRVFRISNLLVCRIVFFLLGPNPRGNSEST